MNALPNVNTRRGGTTPPYIGVIPNVSPEAQSLPVGVSVKYVQHPDKQWYVLRATYARENQAFDFITADHTDAYIPLHYRYHWENNKKKRVLVPLLPGIIFVYANKETIETYVKRTPQLSYLRYYYNRLITDANGYNPPLTVNYREMMNFINATSVDNDHILLVNSNHCHYKSGDRVKIIEGNFKGIEGRVARVAGQQRVLVEIEGLCTIATAYIPSAFIKIISE